MKAVILESYVMEEGDLDWSGVKALVPDTTSYVRTDYADIAPRIGDAELVLINKCRIDAVPEPQVGGHHRHRHG